ncbi:MAG TPA: dienelactone hydrolase family protein [Candidatus Limnocylindrales bacterium]|nr:dienelactone hydrolase family protein [Candidatus Limnocylindrales bacterium]
MNEVSRYLTEEVVVDYADGLISRRDALNRLALLGVATAAAMPMLVACDAKREQSSPPPATPAASTPANPSAPAGPPALATEAITFPGAENRTLQGAFAKAQSPKGSVLVIHENRGLTDHIKSVAGRLAASGFNALAIDLLSAEGGTAKYTDPAQATAALNAAPPARFIADLKAGIDELLRRGVGTKVGVTGFCFGGGQTWALLNAGDPRINAAIPFYGPAPDNPDFTGSPNAKVLGIYGELDERVNASRDRAQAALAKAGLTHDMVTFPGANHAFFNDTGARYDQKSATEAYRRVLDWFGRYLA